jgi:sulfur carrier protein
MSEPSSPKPPERTPAPGTGGAITILVNGEQRQIAAGSTVSALLAALGLADRRVAVERNREIVPRAEHAHTVLADGDRLELVTFVGGG